MDATGVFFRISGVVTLVFTGHDKREWATPRVIFDRIRLSQSVLLRKEGS